MTWEKRKFADIVLKLQNGGTPSTKIPEFWDGNIPWITGADFGNQKLAKIRRYISKRAVQTSSTNVVSKGNLLLVTRTGVGKMAIAPFDVAISQDITGVYFTSEILPDFMLFKFNHEIGYFLRLNQGTSINGITRNDLLDFETELPTSKNEQKRIAEILSTADEAIEQTQSLIDKYNRIKRGLMQDLLTRGIDENGNIRSKQTHKFTVKNGIEVPVDWDVVRFDECYLNPIRDFGSFSSTKMIEFLEEGVPFIKSEMIEVGNINWSSVSFISPEIHKLLNKSYVRKGNLLFSKIGSALGKAVVYELDEECNSNAAVAKIELNPKKANSYFITYFLNFEFAQTQFKNMIVSLLPRLNLGDISSLTVMLPTISEQERIVSILVSVENHIKKELKKLSKLKATKKGLMQDLLSGKVRVKIDE